nr:unnamed protein product [Callosobruchus analis]
MALFGKNGGVIWTFAWANPKATADETGPSNIDLVEEPKQRKSKNLKWLQCGKLHEKRNKKDLTVRRATQSCTSRIKRTKAETPFRKNECA